MSNVVNPIYGVDYTKLTKNTITLINYSKSFQFNYDIITCDTIIDLLKETSERKLNILDIINILNNSLHEVLNTPEFGFTIDNKETILNDLLVSPVKGFYSIEYFLYLDNKHSIEDFYNSIIKYILGQLSVLPTRWCNDQLTA